MLPTAALGGCAHVAAPAGWDCRATIVGQGLRADAWYHVTPSGRTDHTFAEWRLQEPAGRILRFGTVWDGGEGGVDWDSGRVELIAQAGPALPRQARRLELHGAAGRLFHGALDDGPNLLLTAPSGVFWQAAATQDLELVVVDQSGVVLSRTAFNASAPLRGNALAAEALAAAYAKSRDFERLCEPAPVIIAT